MLNSRRLTLYKTIRYFFAILFWLPVTFFSLLLIHNTIPYFTFNKDFSFIQERIVLFADSIYKSCFYIHILAGMLCIGTALIQFSSYILRKRKAIHIWSGRVYVFVVLLLGAPTGLYMSFFAKGSFWERALFLFMAIYWFFTTFKGLQTILKKMYWRIRYGRYAATAWR